MLSLFTKKKLSEEKVANVFVNSVIETVEASFPEVASLINEDPEFVKAPQISPDNMDQFLIIVIAGNLKYLPNHFEPYQDRRILDQIYKKLAVAFGTEADKIQQTISEYHTYFGRVNHPSKNTLYAMSKAVFYKYGLNSYQQEYFRNMKSPNPIFLKRLDEVMENFLFNWDKLSEDFKITQ